MAASPVLASFAGLWQARLVRQAPAAVGAVRFYAAKKGKKGGGPAAPKETVNEMLDRQPMGSIEGLELSFFADQPAKPEFPAEADVPEWVFAAANDTTQKDLLQTGPNKDNWRRYYRALNKASIKKKNAMLQK